jgi:hypothetical protein
VYTLQKQQVQRQQQQHKQLPPDQQAEQDNSLNVLGLAVLKLLQHLVHATIVNHKDVQSQTDATERMCARGTPTAYAYVSLSAHFLGFSRLAECFVGSWPSSEAAAGSSGSSLPSSSSSSSSSSSNSSSSSRDMVRYGKLLLPKLQLVRNTNALPAALVTAQDMCRCINATHNRVQEASQVLGPKAGWLGNRSVLQLQLLLLACQAKLLSRKQGLASCVRCLQPGTSTKQQQQQQPGMKQP